MPLITLLLLILTGCANNPLLQSSEEDRIVVASSIDEATQNLDIHLQDFSKFFMYQSEKFKLPDRSSIRVSDQIMSRHVYIDWSGPANTLLYDLSKMIGYKYQAIGSVPVIPALVSLHHDDIALVDVLRDVTLQIHQKADLAIFSDQRLIELRYKG